MSTEAAQQARAPAFVVVLLRLGVIAALAVDAVIHWRLASGYEVAFPEGLGGGTLFRIEAVVAVLVAVLLAWRGNRLVWALAFVVLASAFAAVVLYRYVPVPQIGPVPSMYEPVWFTEKAVSAVAEAVGAVLAAVGFVLARRSAPSRH